jgi:hypothetical protein
MGKWCLGTATAKSASVVFLWVLKHAASSDWRGVRLNRISFATSLPV